MAKLSARGRKELCRAEKSVSVVDDYTQSPGTKRKSLAYMSDGTCLSKLNIKYDDGSKFDYTWKVEGKYSLEKLDTIKESLLQKGWTIL